jgi:hypothetical protein
MGMEDLVQGGAYADDDNLVVFSGAADSRAIEVTKRLKLSRKNPFEELMLLGGSGEILMLEGSA